MVKIKDFTLASKNLGGTCPRALQHSRPWYVLNIRSNENNKMIQLGRLAAASGSGTGAAAEADG